MKSKEFVKLYKKITLIVFSLLTFLLLILINSNAYAAAVDMTLQKGKLNSSKSLFPMHISPSAPHIEIIFFISV